MILSRLARLGYASIGIVYMIVGALAALAGLGRGGSTGGHQTAFSFIEHQPYGRVPLAVIAVGLIGYSLYRIASAFTDAEHRGSDAKGLALRASSFFRGIVYAGISYEVVRLLMHRGGGSGGDQKTQHWTATIMGKPFGRTILFVAGAWVLVAGAYQLYRAWDAKLSKRLRLGEVDRKIVAISRFGIGARGVVFVVIGGSLIRAALKHNPAAAHGTSGALRSLPEPMLAAVGIGLMAYGVYALVNARYRKL